MLNLEDLRLRQIDGIGERISASVRALEGPLRIAAPFGFERRHVAEILGEVLAGMAR